MSVERRIVMKKGKLFILSGYSGTGKNTIISGLMRDLNNTLTYIPSYTTREMRVHDNETQGSPYNFVSEEQFRKMVENKKFIEYNVIHNNMYGTPVDEYKEAINNGEIIVKDIDVEGAVRMKELFGADACLVFVEPPSLEELYSRLNNRGDSKEQIDLRMKRIDFEKGYKRAFDYTIVNDDLDYAISDLLAIITNYDDKLITEEIDFTSIIPTQSIIGTYNNKPYIKAMQGEELEKPLLYKAHGNYYLLDGHHRLIYHILTGKTKADFLVIKRKTRRYTDINSLDKGLYKKEKNLLLDLLESSQRLETY